MDINKKLEGVFDRNLKIWSTLAKGLNLTIDYVLQPNAIWQEKILSDEEKKIFEFEGQFGGRSIFE